MNMKRTLVFQLLFATLGGCAGETPMSPEVVGLLESLRLPQVRLGMRLDEVREVRPEILNQGYGTYTDSVAGLVVSYVFSPGSLSEGVESPDRARLRGFWITPERQVETFEVWTSLIALHLGDPDSCERASPPGYETARYAKWTTEPRVTVVERVGEGGARGTISVGPLVEVRTNPQPIPCP